MRGHRRRNGGVASLTNDPCIHLLPKMVDRRALKYEDGASRLLPGNEKWRIAP
jgi:hypothetical protein